jgi:diacylglycerol kinase family enzyme
MQATLIYNENAGNRSNLSLEALQDGLGQAGYAPVYKATNHEDDLDAILERPEGLIVSAGGDGTARAVMMRLIGKDAPLAIVPMGTANNIAASLGISADPLAVVTGLAQPREFPFDIGQIHAPWGKDYFLEGAGFGFFADILATYDPEKGKSILRSMQAITNTLLRGHAYENCVRLAGKDECGEFLLVEVLNTTAVGPRLKFAPNASPGDGLLDLVCIRASDREGFLTYLASMVLEDLERLETVTVRPATELTFTWRGFPFHVDGEVRPPYFREQHLLEEAEFGARPYLPQAEAGPISINVLPGAVTLWLPSLKDEK